MNCIECGACCCNPNDLKWIEVTEEDSLKINGDLLQFGDIEKYAMKQNSDGKCIALEGIVGKSCFCKIYENRPFICKKVLPEDEICTSLRKVHNIL